MRSRRIALCLLLSALLTTSACGSPSRLSYIPEGGSYTAGDLADALAASDPGPTSHVTSEDAPQIRQQALANLRSQSEDAAALANTLTSEFPSDIAAVPYRVELGTFEGDPAWIVFESWGEPGQSLDHRRLWVFAYDDRMLLATQSAR